VQVRKRSSRPTPDGCAVALTAEEEACQRADGVPACKNGVDAACHVSTVSTTMRRIEADFIKFWRLALKIHVRNSIRHDRFTSRTCDPDGRSYL
jgi:hypothetical protein